MHSDLMAKRNTARENFNLRCYTGFIYSITKRYKCEDGRMNDCDMMASAQGGGVYAR